MNQEEHYTRIKNIFSSHGLPTHHDKKGCHFHFPFYLTESAEKASIENIELGV